jgi:hypothetical protein
MLAVEPVEDEVRLHGNVKPLKQLEESQRPADRAKRLIDHVVKMLGALPGSQRDLAHLTAAIDDHVVE